jgi:hypothetical protein
MSLWANRSIFAKVFIVLAIAFMSGVGLCGLDFVLAANGIGKNTQEFGVGPLDGVSLVLMILSALALVLTLIAWAATAIFRSVSRGRRGTVSTKPFDDSDVNKD